MLKNLNPHYPFYFFLFLLFFINNSFAGMYKCQDSEGNISFQGKPCLKKETEKVIKYKIKKISTLEQCNSDCEGTYRVCIRVQKNNFYNKKGTKLCKQEKVACSTICIDPEEGEHLKKLAEIEREGYDEINKINKKARKRENEYNKDIDEIDCKAAKRELKSTKEEWVEISKEWYSMKTRNYYRDKKKEIKRTIQKKCR